MHGSLISIFIWIVAVFCIRLAKKTYTETTKNSKTPSFMEHPEPSALSKVFGAHIETGIGEDENFLKLDDDYEEHPDVNDILNTPRKCPFCGAYVRDSEAVCHKCGHEI